MSERFSILCMIIICIAVLMYVLRSETECIDGLEWRKKATKDYWESTGRACFVKDGE